MYTKYSIVIALCLLTLAACSKETVEPETFGNIDGRVIDSETDEGIANVNITTSPATNSIATNGNGSFNLAEVPTGQYSVRAKKSGYESNTVDVNVRQHESATAQVYLDPEGKNSENNMDAEVTAWNETTSNDSTFAEVEYEVRNISDKADIEEYEVYFDVYTSGNTFSQEEGDTSLAAGERNIGQFTKYVRQNNIDSVVVSGTYVSN